MNSNLEIEKDWKLSSLAGSIYSFFVRKFDGEQGTALAQLARELVMQTGNGSSHLVSEQAEVIYKDWSSLPAVGREDDIHPLVRTIDNKLYFRRFFEYEKKVAVVLAKRVENQGNESSAQLGMAVFDSLDEQQKIAVQTALQKDLLLLTGGPGTGKTRTIVSILLAQLLNKPNTRIALAAPTGKAAFRMRQSILSAINSFEIEDSIRSALFDCSRSTTLHRLLGSKLGSVDFRRNEQNPLPHDMVIVDEASMVDLPLMAKLCASLREESKLVLVGDADQLAPVHGGAVFSGLVKASVSDKELSDNLVRLSVNHRRSRSPTASVLGDLCDAIRDGRSNDAMEFVHTDTDHISLFDKLDDTSIDQFILEGFDNLANSKSPDQALSALGDFRILCPHNQGIYGVENWNRRAEGLLPSGKLIPSPVVIGVNDYTVGLFNGDDGVRVGKSTYFWAEEGTREVVHSRLPSHQLGYATSIHRSQGSEFDTVLIVLPPADARLLTRELLYVAASRAKRRIILLGDTEALKAAVERNEESRSGIYDLLKCSI